MKLSYFCLFSPLLLRRQPNAKPQAPPIAEARNERRLLAVACRPMFGREAHPPLLPVLRRPVAAHPRSMCNRRKRNSDLTLFPRWCDLFVYLLDDFSISFLHRFLGFAHL
jgi:hypothetical protein